MPANRLLQQIILQYARIHQNIQDFILTNPDTKHLVSILDGHPWSNDWMWLSCDVVALYPSIPQNEAINMLSMFLDKYANYTLETKQFLVSAVKFLLKHNFFSFDGDFYIQQQGASMGARFSPSLANIFMAMWEETFFVFRS